jgi:hypothetical protein
MQMHTEAHTILHWPDTISLGASFVGRRRDDGSRFGRRRAEIHRWQSTWMAIRLEMWRGSSCLGAVDGDAAFISIIPDDLVNDKKMICQKHASTRGCDQGRTSFAGMKVEHGLQLEPADPNPLPLCSVARSKAQTRAAKYRTPSKSISSIRRHCNIDVP